MHNMIKREGVPINSHEIPSSHRRHEEQHGVAEGEVAMMSARQLKQRGEELRDQIANDMWRSYQTIMRSRRFMHIEDN